MFRTFWQVTIDSSDNPAIFETRDEAVVYVSQLQMQYPDDYVYGKHCSRYGEQSLSWVGGKHEIWISDDVWASDYPNGLFMYIKGLPFSFESEDDMMQFIKHTQEITYYLNGEPYQGECAYIDGFNGYTRTDNDGMLCALINNSLWNKDGVPNTLKNESGDYIIRPKIKNHTIYLINQYGIKPVARTKEE